MLGNTTCINDSGRTSGGSTASLEIEGGQLFDLSATCDVLSFELADVERSELFAWLRRLRRLALARSERRSH